MGRKTRLPGLSRRQILQLEAPEKSRQSTVCINKNTNPLGLITQYEDSSEEEENTESPKNTDISNTTDKIDDKLAEFMAEINTASNFNDDKDNKSNAVIEEPPACPWQECYDEGTQCVYYWNTESNEVTWEIPEEYKQYCETLTAYQEQHDASVRQETAQENSNHTSQVQSSADDVVQQPASVATSRSTSREGSPMVSNRLDAIQKSRESSPSLGGSGRSSPSNGGLKSKRLDLSKYRREALEEEAHADSPTHKVDTVDNDIDEGLLKSSPIQSEKLDLESVPEQTNCHSQQEVEHNASGEVDFDDKPSVADNSYRMLGWVKGTTLQDELQSDLQASLNTPRSPTANQAFVQEFEKLEREFKKRKGAIRIEGGKDQTASNSVVYGPVLPQEEETKEAEGSEMEVSPNGQKRPSEEEEENDMPAKRARSEEPSEDMDIAIHVAEIEERSSIIMEKLEYLEITRNNLTKLQILLIEFETRFEDWKSHALETNFFLAKLKQFGQELKSYEAGAAPKNWTCHWDRNYKRYFYCNELTGISQWDYPEASDMESQSSESDTDSVGKTG